MTWSVAKSHFLDRPDGSPLAGWRQPPTSPSASPDGEDERYPHGIGKNAGIRTRKDSSVFQKTDRATVEYSFPPPMSVFHLLWRVPKWLCRAFSYLAVIYKTQLEILYHLYKYQRFIICIRTNYFTEAANISGPKTKSNKILHRSIRKYAKTVTINSGKRDILCHVPL